MSDITLAARARPHISHTQVSMFEECSLRWFLRYICGIRKPESIQMMLGRVFHEVMAVNMRQKVVHMLDMPIDELVDRYYLLFDQHLKSGSCLLQPGQFPPEFREGGAALLRHYIASVAGPLMPRLVSARDTEGNRVDIPAVELEIKREIPGTDIDFVGVLDLWDVSGPVIDYKVTGKPWSPKDSAKQRQGMAYGFLLEQPIEMIFHVGTRDEEKPRVQKIALDITEDTITRYKARLWSVVDQMRALASGELAPRPKAGFCSPKFCAHKKECEEWKSGIGEFAPRDTPWLCVDDAAGEAA